MKELFDFEDWNIPVGHKPTLLPVQEDLLTRGRQAYRDGIRRVIWQAPCGGGKTVVASKQTELALDRGKTIMHVVHRRRLVDQMVRTLARFNVQASPIMADRQRWSSKVTCASRDTLLAMLKDGQQLPKPDLILFDEAHVGSTELERWYLQNHPSAFWTGYTATPVRNTGRSLAPPYEALVCMAPASELIRIGRLCRVKVYNPDGVGRRRKKGEKVKPVGDPVEHWKKYALGLPTVVFAATVKESQDICAKYNEAGIVAEHIDASTDEDERDAVFERSRTGHTKIICNCGVMIEGVDLPWLVCCQILRGCNSLVLWVQACGRVMRAFTGKEFGIILDHSGAAHEFGLPDSDFIWELDDEKANTKANKPPKDRKPVTCMSCGAVFVGKEACPECGRVLPKKHRKSLVGSMHGDSVLTEFSGEQNGNIRQDFMERLWKKALFIGRAKGWQMRQVAGIFSREAKCAPWEAGLDVKLPRGKDGWAISVSDWMRNQ